ncbi:MAG: hypothetical protein OK449_04050 [Thaumarchaeota archaeon]|nr:hypothetical protein [Nitrososphaerota archaeon]
MLGEKNRVAAAHRRIATATVTIQYPATQATPNAVNLPRKYANTPDEATNQTTSK